MKKVFVLLVAVVIVGVLFFVLKPQPQAAQNKQTEAQRKAESGSELRTFTLQIRDGELVSGDKTLKVNQGDEVRITVTSDTADELHLHGYDKEAELAAGKPSELAFTADIAGRFEAELHHADKTAFALEVQPK